MEQGHSLRLATIVLLVAFLPIELGAFGFSFDAEHKGTHFRQPDRTYHRGIGGDSDWRKYISEQRQDLTNIKRVLEAQRGRSGAGRDLLKGRTAGFKSRSDDNPPSPAGILGTLSERGLEYVKDVLVGEILDELTPMTISDITSQVNSPIGRVDALVSDIVLEGAQVQYSDIDLGQGDITIYAAGVTATLVMNWEYEYSASYVPWPIGDSGWAQVTVTGMQAGVSFKLAEDNGTLRLAVHEAGTYIEDLEIQLHGGASWFYQWFVYAFDYNIRAAVEVALTQEIVDGAEELDDWLLHLPRAIPIDDTSAIDVTVVHDPLLNPTYLSVGAKGEFVAMDWPQDYPEPETDLPAGLFCDQSVKMVTIALSDYVLNSAAFVYYDTGELIWDVDNLPGKKYLNTASWKYIIPQLYRKYPNKDMAINFAVSSVPTVDITKSGIKAVAGVDMTIEVKDNGNLVPVACISLMVSFDAKAGLSYSNVTGEATLDDLTLSLKWSDVGSFPMYLVQATVRAIMKDVVLPLINLTLRRGFPIPMVAGVQIESADLRYEDGYLLVCTDIHYAGGYFQEQRAKTGAPKLHSSQ